MQNLKPCLLFVLREKPCPTKSDTFHEDDPSFFQKRPFEKFVHIQVIWTGECQRHIVLGWTESKDKVIKSKKEIRSFLHSTQCENPSFTQNSSQTWTAAMEFRFLGAIFALGIKGSHGDGFKLNFIDWMRLCLSYNQGREGSKTTYRTWNDLTSVIMVRMKEGKADQWCPICKR
jgi:hypothetical protein